MLFLGCQDAMQRTTLVSLKQWKNDDTLTAGFPIVLGLSVENSIVHTMRFMVEEARSARERQSEDGVLSGWVGMGWDGLLGWTGIGERRVT
jgi:hypothetical protein